MDRYRIMTDVLRGAAQEQGTDSIASWLQGWKQLTYASHQDFIRDFSNIIETEGIFYDQIEQDILTEIQTAHQENTRPSTIPVFDYGTPVHTIPPAPYQKGIITSISWHFTTRDWLYQLSTSSQWLAQDTLHTPSNCPHSRHSWLEK